MTYKASCCCGKSEIQVEGEPLLNCVCHCDNCKQRTGSAFGMSAYFPTESFKILKNATSTYKLNSDLGKQERHFCTHCGTTLFWYIELFKDTVGVAAGCFTKTPLPQPSFNNAQKNQCTWVSFEASVNNKLTLDDIPSK